MPDKLAVCGLLLALSFTVRVPVFVPVTVGENVTLIVQLFLLLNVVVQVEVEMAKGAFVEYERPVRVVDTLFFNVNFLAALVEPTLVLGKV